MTAGAPIAPSPFPRPPQLTAVVADIAYRRGPYPVAGRKSPTPKSGPPAPAGPRAQSQVPRISKLRRGGGRMLSRDLPSTRTAGTPGTRRRGMPEDECAPTQSLPAGRFTVSPIGTDTHPVIT